MAESQHHITNPSQPLPNFAEQWAIDCNPFGFGCPTGGSSRNILQSWMMNDGNGSPVQPVLEKDYPYNTPGSAGTCNTSKPKYNATVESFSVVHSLNNPSALVDALQHGPVLTSLQGSSSYFL